MNLGKGLQIWLSHFYSTFRIWKILSVLYLKELILGTPVTQKLEFLHYLGCTTFRPHSSLQVNDYDTFDTKNSCTITMIIQKLYQAPDMGLSGHRQSLMSIIVEEDISKDQGQVPLILYSMGIESPHCTRRAVSFQPSWELFCFTWIIPSFWWFCLA